MKNKFLKRMDEAYARCPGVVMAEMPGNELATGHVLIEPACCKAALDFLKRRFHVEKKEIIEATGELRFQITPRLRRTRNGPVVRVKYQKPVQFELSLA